MDTNFNDIKQIFVPEPIRKQKTNYNFCFDGIVDILEDDKEEDVYIIK